MSNIIEVDVTKFNAQEGIAGAANFDMSTFNDSHETCLISTALGLLDFSPDPVRRRMSPGESYDHQGPIHSGLTGNRTRTRDLAPAFLPQKPEGHLGQSLLSPNTNLR